ncbi:hypothetical protein [Streptomyces marincola]|nr:hypothetical protein [Streptomyces marincola]
MASPAGLPAARHPRSRTMTLSLGTVILGVPEVKDARAFYAAA